MATETSMAGRVLGGRYRLGQRIGTGGVAEVYQADDLVLERPVAVKLLHPAAEATGSARERLAAEVRLLARLSHPGLVTVYDTGEEDGRAYLVMRLVEGGTLADRLADGPLSADEAARIGADLADVLGHLHDQRLVHRDVKPSNVLFDENGRVLLTDLGVARLLDTAHLTATNATIGTAAYMSPEQVRGGTVGPPTDVYALGLVLVECVSGRPAYTGGSSLEVAMARLHRPPEVSTAQVPAPLAGLLDAMTRTDPAQRPTASEAARRLRDPREDADATEVLRIPPTGPGSTGVLPVLPDEQPAPDETPAPVEEPAPGTLTDRARAAWALRRRRTPWGPRLDVTLVAGLAVVLLVALAFSSLSQTGNTTAPGDAAGSASSGSTPTPSPSASSTAPGPDRLPADLDRLERTVTP